MRAWVAHSYARHLANDVRVFEGLSPSSDNEQVEIGSSAVNAFSKLRLTVVPVDPATEKLARKLAAATGKALPTIVREAIEAQAAAAGVSVRPAPAHSSSDLLKKMTAITDGFAALPVLDPRSADEMLGYDEHGVPR